ncbi:MAG: asparagine synthase (glutamine-hydrolyzing) [Chitinophagaceae bacterium]|jgi:asparagine synthase (glutamine-hydrolysing)|nr:asparagine synthase (glutamine-hydrolyzing) [Chitinophagaceae bacterium]
MCGIAGILHFDKTKTVNETALTVCRDTMYHRGPDSGNNYIESNIGLAHRRLNIIDLTSQANQPMFSNNGNYVLTFNGEIYNYIELRNKLEQEHQVVFRTNSDTEVLVEMYAHYGKEMLNYLNGMFAFAIWDKAKREIFIARDRVGIKPLFYSINSEQLVFASEIKPLLKVYVQPEILESALNELLFFRFVSGENTLFKDLKRLLPGHYLIVSEDGKQQNVCWWNLKSKVLNSSPIKEPIDWFFNTFNDSVKKHIIADVPVGVLLSGGLDSSSILASLNHSGITNINTFNVGFSDPKHDESKIAQRISKEFNFPFHSIRVEDDLLFENTLRALNGFGDTLVHQSEPQLIAISKYANEHVKVLLSGEGADEMMGGYVRYKALNFFALPQVIKKGLKFVPDIFKSPRLKKLENYLQLGSISNAILFNSVNNYPNEFAKYGMQLEENTYDYRLKIMQDAEELYPESSARQAMYLDFHTYLNSLNDRNDRTTMAASIECRVPFLDHRIIEGLHSLPNHYFVRGKKGKFILSEAFGKYLPKEVMDFKKIGFSVPWSEYISKNDFFRNHWDNMDKSQIMQMGALKLLDLNKIKQEYVSNKHASDSLVRQMFFLTLWYENYFQDLA